VTEEEKRRTQKLQTPRMKEQKENKEIL
jgi:hypothetical protein